MGPILRITYENMVTSYIFVKALAKIHICGKIYLNDNSA